MGGGYLSVVSDGFKVLDADKAYDALSKAVENRTYNFGELRLDENNQLEIINNHKHTFFYRNNTITTAQENQRAREAAYAILNAKYGNKVDLDTLAIVKNFLCGDKTIAEQPLTRDEVANMIKLLKSGPDSKDSAVKFLRESYQFKHGLLNSDAVSGLNRYAHAQENRLSENVLRASEKQRDELKDMFEVVEYKKSVRDDQILKKVLGRVLSNSSNSAASHLLAKLNDPSRLSGEESVNTYFRDAISAFVCRSLEAKKGGSALLDELVQCKLADSVKKLGGDNQTVIACWNGGYAPKFDAMRDQALKAMIEDKADVFETKFNEKTEKNEQILVRTGWDTLATELFSDKRSSMLDEFFELKMTALRRDVTSAEPGAMKREVLTVKQEAMSKLRDMFTNLMSLPKDADSKDFRAAFQPLLAAFKLQYTKGNLLSSNLLSGEGSKLFGKVVRAFFDNGGDLAETRTALAAYKGMLHEELRLTNTTMADITKAATNEKSRIEKEQGADGKSKEEIKAEKTVRCKEVDRQADIRRRDCFQRGVAIAEASMLVEILDELLTRTDGKADKLMKALTFASQEEIVSDNPHASRQHLVDSWVREGSFNDDINSFVLDLTRWVVTYNRDCKIDGQTLDSLMADCERHLGSFCDKMFDSVKWGEKPTTDEAKKIFNLVQDKSIEGLKFQRQIADEDFVPNGLFNWVIDKATEQRKNDPHIVVPKQEDLEKSVPQFVKEKRTAFENLCREFGFKEESEVKPDKQISPAQPEQAKSTDSASLVDKAASDRFRDLNTKLAYFLSDDPYPKGINGYIPEVSEIDSGIDGYVRLPSNEKEKIKPDSLQNEVVKALKNDGLTDLASTVELMISSMPYVKSDDNNITKGGLTHEPIHLAYIVDAFTENGAVERNERIFSAAKARCAQEFGMSKEEVQRFVDPAVVAISIKSFDYDRFGESAKVPSELQLDRIMQFAITKAKTVLEGSKKGSREYKCARDFLWRMQESVKAARGQLADQFWPLVNELNPGVSEVNFTRKLSQIILEQKHGNVDEKKKLIGDIGKLLVDSSGKEVKYTYKDTKKKSILGFERTVTRERGITSNMSDTDNNERVDRSRGFWLGMHTFLHRLDRLQATIAKCGGVNVEPKDEKKTIGSESWKFVDKVRERFGNASFIREELVSDGENEVMVSSVNAERFQNFVKANSSMGDLRRTNFSLSFVF